MLNLTSVTFGIDREFSGGNSIWIFNSEVSFIPAEPNWNTESAFHISPGQRPGVALGWYESHFQCRNYLGCMKHAFNVEKGNRQMLLPPETFPFNPKRNARHSCYGFGGSCFMR